MPGGRAPKPMTRWSATACTGGEVAGHPAAAHARGGRGSSSRPSPLPPPTGAAAAALVATVWVVGDTAPQGPGGPLACPPSRAKDAQAEMGLPATVQTRASLAPISSRAILRHRSHDGSHSRPRSLPYLLRESKTSSR